MEQRSIRLRCTAAASRLALLSASCSCPPGCCQVATIALSACVAPWSPQACIQRSSAADISFSADIAEGRGIGFTCIVHRMTTGPQGTTRDHKGAQSVKSQHFGHQEQHHTFSQSEGRRVFSSMDFLRVFEDIICSFSVFFCSLVNPI